MLVVTNLPINYQNSIITFMKNTRTNTPRKTRTHLVLFVRDTPFKPKRVALKTRYKRKPKHTQIDQ